MANDTNYFGLRPVRHINGSAWNGLTEKCYINTDYAPLLYIGDPVAITTDSSASDATALYSSVQLAGLGTTEPVYGVITSFDLHEDTSDQKVYKPASTERYMNVFVMMEQLYLMLHGPFAMLTWSRQPQVVLIPEYPVLG